MAAQGYWEYVPWHLSRKCKVPYYLNLKVPDTHFLKSSHPIFQTKPLRSGLVPDSSVWGVGVGEFDFTSQWKESKEYETTFNLHTPKPTDGAPGHSNDPQAFCVWNVYGDEQHLFLQCVLFLCQWKKRPNVQIRAGRLRCCTAGAFLLHEATITKMFFLCVFCLLLTSFRAFLSHGSHKVRAARDTCDKIWFCFIDEEI